ncbi:hypothetical protein [Mammaliicoccus sciuri]|uniref:hypothetical protein n=1 Tax=Mammaliicoccus sciuri TaxID=1296 RepID=UPI000D1E1CE4|nr:hypothetical protein [Mammaliicoccus sciuri]PTJ47149.1 hypothetical protein BUZ98_01800 [Mammaliicoccus sciuri]
MNNELESFLRKNRPRIHDNNVDKIILEAISKKIPIDYQDVYDAQNHFGSYNTDLIIPSVVTEFISRIEESEKAQVLVAWNHYGEWLKDKGAKFKNITFLNDDEIQAKITKCLQGELTNQEIVIGDPLKQLDNQAKESFDMILGFPPLGIRGIMVINGQEVREDLNHLALLKTLNLLKENGKIFFIVTERFFNRNSKKSIINKIEEANVFLESALFLPPGTFHPKAGIGSYLITLSKQKKDSLFIGELKEGTRETLFQNWRDRKEGKVLQLGKFVQQEDFRSYNQIEKELEIERIVKRSNLKKVPAHEIFDKVNSNLGREQKDVEHKEKAIYIPKIGLSNVVNKVEQMNNKPQNYFQVILKENTNTTYITNWFNSKLGKVVRESLMSGVYISNINKSTLLNATLYLPEQDNQQDTNKIQSKINDIKIELDEIENKVWNRPHKTHDLMKQLNNINKEEGLQEWIETLPFPLASILYKYYATTSIVSKKDLLLHFFEAYSQFQVMIMLSVTTQEGNEIDEKYIYPIDSDRLKMATFGNWVVTGQNMAKRIRTFLNDNPAYCLEVFRHNRRDLIEKMVSKSIYSVLETTLQFRNNWKGHGGVESESKAKERLGLLETELQNVRKIIGNVFEDYNLIRPGEGYYSDGLFHLNCQLLKGSRTTFLEKDLQFINPIDIKDLYLHEEGNHEALKLLPFVKMLAGPETKMDACYFYNRIDKDGVKMISYYFDEDSEVTLKDNERILSIFHAIKSR